MNCRADTVLAVAAFDPRRAIRGRAVIIEVDAIFCPLHDVDRATILREAEEAMFARGLEAREQEFLDSLHVMEVGMRHFFAKAMHAKTNKGKPETIDANMLQAVSIAEKIAPHKHARLSAVKLAGEAEVVKARSKRRC